MSREIVDIIGTIVNKISESLSLITTDYKGDEMIYEPEINYIFGSAEYFKDYLDESQRIMAPVKLPAIVLFCPINEKRDDPKYFTKANVNLLIVCSTQKAWSNEQRKVFSFENILRPIYNKLLEALASDERLDFGYKGLIKHEYSENYSYGKYGAYVNRSGEMVSEPIDAIDIRNLEIKVKPKSCR